MGLANTALVLVAATRVVSAQPASTPEEAAATPDQTTSLRVVASIDGSYLYQFNPGGGGSSSYHLQTGGRGALELGKFGTPSHWIGHLGFIDFRTYDSFPGDGWSRYYLVDVLAAKEYRWCAAVLGVGAGFAIGEQEEHSPFGGPVRSNVTGFPFVHGHASYDLAELEHVTVAARADANVGVALYLSSLSLGVSFQLR